jgi:hypothetical protein
MQAPARGGKFLRSKAVLATATFLTFALPPSSGGTSSEDSSTATDSTLHSTCTFSDESTITFGRQDSGRGQSAAEGWRTGDYDATTLHVSERMLIPPLDHPLQIPAGSYTLFVMDNGEPPWTLIVSRKTGEWGMPYPGEQYDLGRTYMGSDVEPSVDKFTIGCRQSRGGPVFVWMQSGRYSALLKILAVNPKEGYLAR